MTLTRAAACLACLALLAATGAAQPARFRLVESGGRYLLQSPDGSRALIRGMSLERWELPLLPTIRYLGLNPVHFWTGGPREAAECAHRARAVGLQSALLAPGISHPARFHDGSASASHYPWKDSPTARVPDIYDPRWQASYLADVIALRDALGEDLASVAILWLTNEPEVYHSYGPWTGPDFCIDTPACRAESRRFMEVRYRDIADLNAAWSRDGHYAYSFPDFAAFEDQVLDQLFADFADGDLNPVAHADLLDFVRKWLNDWSRICADTIRNQAGITTPLLGMRIYDGVFADWSYTPHDGLDFLGINAYPGPFDEAYYRVPEAAHRASGLPVLVSEWFVQDSDPGDLGYICGDRATLAEQAAFGADLACQVPGGAGIFWQTYRPNSGSLLDDADGALRPLAFHLALGAQMRPGDAPGRDAWALDGFGYRSSAVQVGPSSGPEDRLPAVRYKHPGRPVLSVPGEISLDAPGVFIQSGALREGALAVGGAGSLGRLARAIVQTCLPESQVCRARVDATARGNGADASASLSLNGTVVGTRPLIEGDQRLAFDLPAVPGPCYLTLTLDAGASPGSQVSATRLAIEAGGEAAPPPALLPLTPLAPDLDTLPVVFEDHFTRLDPSRWSRWQGTAAGGAARIVDGTWLEIVGEPDSRAGLIMSQRIAGEAAVVEVHASAAANPPGGNLILNLVFDEVYPRRPLVDWLLHRGPIKANVMESGAAADSRLEFGWAPGAFWEWRICGSLACPGPAARVAAPPEDLNLRLVRTGCQYELSVNGRPCFSVREPALSGPFRVMLYGFGSSVTRWDSVVVRAR